MFADEKLEMKVGLFIGIGIFLMFLMVFFIRDITVLGKGYDVNVIFDYVNGLTADAPVRLAGVDVGEVKSIELFYDEEAEGTRVRLSVRLKRGSKIETDAVVTINTLGLLGEQYLEMSPGKKKVFLGAGDTLVGQNPLNVGRQMTKMNELLASLTNIARQVEKGEGSLGKFIMEDTFYDDLEVVMGRLRNGEGTIGKLLVEEKIYDDMEYFVSDIKAHPWKLLKRTRDVKKDSKSHRVKESEN